MKILTLSLVAGLLLGALSILGCAPKEEKLPANYNTSNNPSTARKQPAAGNKAD
jgi:hypothetical protein